MKHPAEIAQKVLNHIKRLEHRLDKAEKDRLTHLLGANLILSVNLENPEDSKADAKKEIDFWKHNDNQEILKKQVNCYENQIMRIDCAVKHGLTYRNYVLKCNG